MNLKHKFGRNNLPDNYKRRFRLGYLSVLLLSLGGVILRICFLLLGLVFVLCRVHLVCRRGLLSLWSFIIYPTVIYGIYL